MNNRKLERNKSKTENQIGFQCACCGESNAEYILDDRCLCCDCYKTESKLE